MNISIASARCALQVALLGSVTNNVRAVSTTISGTDFIIYFYYDKEPSDEEIDLSEIVSTEVICSFAQATAEVVRVVLPEPKKPPQDDDTIWVYFRYEESPQED